MKLLESTVYILTGIIDFLLIIKFVELFLQPKFPYKQQKKLFYNTILILVFMGLVSFFSISKYLSFLYTIIYLIFIIKCYNGFLWKKIIFTMIEPISLGIVGFFIEIILYQLIGVRYVNDQSDLGYSCLRLFIVYISLYIVISLLEIFKNKRSRHFKNPYSLSIFSIVFLNIIFLCSVVSYYRISDFSQKSFENLIIIILVGVMLIIFFSIILYNSLLEHLETEYNTKLKLQFIELQQDFYEKITQSSKTLKSLRHDLKNHLIVIEGYLNRNKIEDAKIYIHEITELTKKTNVIINIDNIVLSSVLNNKKTICEEKGISFHYNINLGQQFITDSDLCILISNILDNAIEASVQITENKGFIDLDIDDSHEVLSIHCTNNYVTPPILVKGNLISTKQNRISHGIGLLNVEEIVRKYDGTMNHKFENFIFSVDILLKS